MKNNHPRMAPAGVNQSVVTLIDNLKTHLEKPVRGRGYLHRIRVDVKRLRAWIRLIRDEEDTVGLRAIDRDLRDLMKKLTSHRDRQALRETLQWLERKAGKKPKKSSLRTLAAHMHKGEPQSRLDWGAIKTALTGVLGTLRQHTQTLDSSHRVRDGLQRTYKRAAKSGERAFAGKINPAEVHEFRKWAKYLYYQLEFVQTVYPELYVDAMELLEDLGNRLGRYHDLILLQGKLSQLPVKKRHSGHVEQASVMIDVRMHKLLRRANRHYRKIFTSSSSKFVMDLP